MQPGMQRLGAFTRKMPRRQEQERCQIAVESRVTPLLNPEFGTHRHFLRRHNHINGQFNLPSGQPGMFDP